MTFLDDLSEGISSATHIIGTTAQAAGSIANIIGAIGGILAEGDPQAPIIETLHDNIVKTTGLLQSAAETALSTPDKSTKGFTVGTPTFVMGIVRNKRVLALTSPLVKARARAGAMPTPLMYADLLSLFQQNGIDAQGSYEGLLRENAYVAAQALFSNSVVVDPQAKNPIDVQQFMVHDRNGIPVLKMANASYNLQLDQSGLKDVSHGVLAFAPNSSLSPSQLSTMRARRVKESADIWGPRSPATGGGGPVGDPTPGWTVMLRVAVRTGAIVVNLATQIQALAVSESWDITSCTIAGSVIALSILTAEAPCGVQEDLIDWICGRMTGPNIPQPPPGVVLDSLVIQDSMPATIPPSLIKRQKQ